MILALMTFGPIFALVLIIAYHTSYRTESSSKQRWIMDAKRYFLENADLEDWTDEQIEEYLESLYNLFVRDCRHIWTWTGKQAVKEDMSYWDK